jgi:hypothetical protein
MQLSDELLHECQKLLYRAWAIAYDEFKAVRAEKDDGSDDWATFHQHHRLASEKELNRLAKLRAELDPHCPLTKFAKTL